MAAIIADPTSKRSPKHSGPACLPTFEILPSYNVAPQTFQPVVAFNRKTLERRILQMRWGLVPYWANDPKIGLQHHQCESRDSHHEPHVSRGFQAPPLPHPGRWLLRVAAHRQENKAAVRLRSEGRLTVRAGRIIRHLEGKKTGQELLSYSVITTDPNELLEPFHNRMPVILRPGGLRTLDRACRAASTSCRSAPPLSRRIDGSLENWSGGWQREER